MLKYIDKYILEFQKTKMFIKKFYSLKGILRDTTKA